MQEVVPLQIKSPALCAGLLYYKVLWIALSSHMTVSVMSASTSEICTACEHMLPDFINCKFPSGSCPLTLPQTSNRPLVAGTRHPPALKYGCCSISSYR